MTTTANMTAREMDQVDDERAEFEAAMRRPADEWRFTWAEYARRKGEAEARRAFAAARATARMWKATMGPGAGTPSEEHV